MDKRLTHTFIDLLCYSSIGGAPIPDCTDFHQWPELFKLAMFHNVLPVIYKAISEKEVFCDISEKNRQSLRKFVLARCVQQTTANTKLLRLLQAMDRENIQTVLMKGLIIAELYKDPSTRVSCDADILIQRKDYKKATNLLVQHGYVLQKNDSQEEVKNFSSPGLSIDLHLRLWGDIRSKHITVVEPLAIDNPDKARYVLFDGVSVQTLGYQEHFIYLLVHFAKHFIIKGAGLRHLLDISLYYNAYREHIDVSSLWDLLSSMGFDQLYCNIFYICCKQLHMNCSIFGKSRSDYTPSKKLIKEVLSDIITAGVFGSTPERSVSSNVVKESYYLEGKYKGNFGLFLHMLFPHPMALSKKYFYARKHKWLLPIAWVHRMYSFFVNRITKRDHLNLREAVSTANERIRLLEHLDLVDSSQKKNL